MVTSNSSSIIAMIDRAMSDEYSSKSWNTVDAWISDASVSSNCSAKSSTNSSKKNKKIKIKN